MWLLKVSVAVKRGCGLPHQHVGVSCLVPPDPGVLIESSSPLEEGGEEGDGVEEGEPLGPQAGGEEVTPERVEGVKEARLE